MPVHNNMTCSYGNLSLYILFITSFKASDKAEINPAFHSNLFLLCVFFVVVFLIAMNIEQVRGNTVVSKRRCWNLAVVVWKGQGCSAGETVRSDSQEETIGPFSIWAPL